MNSASDGINAANYNYLLKMWKKSEISVDPQNDMQMDRKGVTVCF